MKKLVVLGTFMLLGVFTLTTMSSCNNDDDETQNTVAKPTLTVEEIGIENNKTGLAGSDIHTEGDITAPGKVKTFSIKVYDKTGTEIGEKIFDEKNPDTFVGNINPHFHIHIPLQSDAALGEGKIVITVIDETGQTVEFSEAITIKPAIVNNVDGLNVTGPDGQKAEGKPGEEMTVTAAGIEMNPGYKIDGIEVEFHNEVAGREIVFTSEKPEEEGATPVESLKKYVGQTSVKNFKESFKLPEDAPAGEYHLHFTLISGDNEQTFEFEGIKITK